MNRLAAGAGGIWFVLLASVAPALALANDKPQALPVPKTRPATASEATDKPPGLALPNEPPAIPSGASPPPVEPRDAACETALKEAGAVFEIASAEGGGGGCGVAYPVVIKALEGGVTVAPETKMTCQAALALALWTRDVVVPAAKTLGEGVRLTGLTNAATYVCRNRNNQTDTKLSEHASGNAIDISAFGFSGHETIAVTDRDRTGTADEAFQKAVRFGACLHFKTVLGPGSDAYHGDHLHLDMAERRGGYRLCGFPDGE